MMPRAEKVLMGRGFCRLPNFFARRLGAIFSFVISLFSRVRFQGVCRVVSRFLSFRWCVKTSEKSEKTKTLHFRTRSLRERHEIVIFFFKQGYRGIRHSWSDDQFGTLLHPSEYVSFVSSTVARLRADLKSERAFDVRVCACLRHRLVAPCRGWCRNYSNPVPAPGQGDVQ